MFTRHAARALALTIGIAAATGCAPRRNADDNAAARSADGASSTKPAPVAGESSPQLSSQGKEVFRFDTFGNEKFWSDTLRMHEVIEKSVDPTTA
jgi:hypothetical protein